MERGHTRSVTHGAQSPRLVQPIADRILAEQMEHLPDYLRVDRSYCLTLRAWSYSEAQCQMLRDYIDAMGGIQEALTDRIETRETEEYFGDRTRRVSVQRRINAALEQLRRCEAHAAALRRDLGLTPQSRSRMGRDMAITAKLDMAQALAELEEL